MRLGIHDEAVEDARDAFDWYAERSQRTADQFAELFEEAVVSIVRNPRSNALVEEEDLRGEFRRLVMKKFKFSIIYHVGGERVLVVAVAHPSRDPGYWMHRAQE
ncbi:MAG: type II toxin-antitoxin system RelE/ParE family toxin [Pirellulaceae bacterium]